MNEIFENFQAELYLSEDESFLADGTASVDLENQWVTFNSEFVPLYELETKVYITRIFNGKEIHRFEGKVYLSDKKLMRIVSVEDNLLEGSEICYSSNVKFDAALSSVVKNPDGSIQSKIKQLKNIEFDIEIKDMTTNKVFIDVYESYVVSNFIKKLIHKTDFDIEKIELGQNFSIIKSEKLKEIVLNVKINKAYHFGDIPRFECDILNTSQQEVDSLKEFLWDYNLENNKLF